MSNQVEMRLTGSGGQGVILATIILAQAALMAGKQVAQSQSYGPEARGGMCKAETIVSDSPIAFPKVTHPDFLLALTQESLDKYSKEIPAGCVVMADASLTIPAHLDPANVVHIPILEAASVTVGKALTANIVAVGAINAVFGLIPAEIVREATLSNVPKGMGELNLKALQTGIDLVKPEHKRVPKL